MGENTQRRYFEGSMFRAIREDESSAPEEEVETEEQSLIASVVFIGVLALVAGALIVVIVSLT